MGTRPGLCSQTNFVMVLKINDLTWRLYGIFFETKIRKFFDQMTSTNHGFRIENARQKLNYPMESLSQWEHEHTWMKFDFSFFFFVRPKMLSQCGAKNLARPIQQQLFAKVCLQKKLVVCPLITFTFFSWQNHKTAILRKFKCVTSNLCHWFLSFIYFQRGFLLQNPVNLQS